VADGAFDLHLWVPESGRGPGILLIQEVWGVGPYIRKVAEDLAALGYVVGAPDLFWRIARGWAAGHDDEGLARSMEVASRFDFDQGVADAASALTHLTGLPEVTGGTGVMGFCLGGSIAYVLAATTKPDAVVSLYGSAVPDATALMSEITSPIQFHFGGSDPYISRDRIALVETAAATAPNAEIHVQEEAGHAFHNHEAPRFHNPEAAEVAWALILRFLNRHLPVG
jgi:carboxymethylenebutenolidase